MTIMPDLFSYGTFRLESVQIATFGRILDGAPDVLDGWREFWVTIRDTEVLRRSNRARHPILAPGDGPPIAGEVFTLTESELAQADAYEVEDYVRVELALRSGRWAFVYVGREAAGPAALRIS